MLPQPDPRAVGAQIEKLRDVLDNIQQLPTPKFTPLVMERETVVCQCGKRRLISPEMFFLTGAIDPTGKPIQAVEPLCSDCLKDYAGTARVVCVKCEPPRVVARWAPNTDPVTGLVISAERTYHANGCVVCKPQGRSVLIEQYILLQRLKKV
jgi:hypothetical protein